jgi:hypothetical protein
MAAPKITERKPTKGRVKLLYALPHLDCMVYVLRIDDDIFMSLSVIKGAIFQFYLEMTPREGKKRLSKKEEDQTLQIVLAGAHTTIEQKIGVKQNAVEAARAAEVMKVAENAWGKKIKPKEVVN